MAGNVCTLAADSLKGHRKLEACLKAGPTVKISCTKSSMQMMLCLPKACNIELAEFSSEAFEVFPKASAAKVSPVHI